MVPTTNETMNVVVILSIICIGPLKSRNANGLPVPYPNNIRAFKPRARNLGKLGLATRKMESITSKSRVEGDIQEEEK